MSLVGRRAAGLVIAVGIFTIGLRHVRHLFHAGRRRRVYPLQPHLDHHGLGPRIELRASRRDPLFLRVSLRHSRRAELRQLHS